MATTLAPVGAAAAAAAAPPPAALSSSPPKHASAPPPTSAPPPPGGPATAGFFRVVDEVRDFLAGEAAAEGWSAAGGCEPAGAGAGADASAADPARRARPGRPPPDWDWVAGQLLPLLQQYSAGLSEPVMRTAIWQAWRTLPDGGHADAAASTRWTPWAAATNPSTRDPATLEVAVLGGRPADTAAGLPAVVEVMPTVGGEAPPPAAAAVRPISLLLHSSAAGWVGAVGLAEPGEEDGSPLTRGCVLRLGGVRAWRPVVPGGGGGGDPSAPAAPRPPVRFLPTPAVMVVARDRAAALAAARRLATAAGRASKVVPPGQAAAAAPSGPSSSSSFARPPAAILDGLVVGVGPPEQPDSAACSRSRTGAARAVWLGDGGPATAPPTPLLLLDGWAAAAAALAPGDRLVLLGAEPVPSAPGTPPALEVWDGGGGAVAAWVVPGVEEGGSGGGGADQDGGPPAPRPGTTRRAPLAALSPGTRRVALAGVARSVTLVPGGGSGGAPPHVRLCLADGEGEGAAVSVCIPVRPGAAPCPAARAALAARPGDAVLAVCSAARLVRGEGTGAGPAPLASLPAQQGTPPPGRPPLDAWPSSAAAPFTVQALARMPSLLASPALWEASVQGLEAVTTALAAADDDGVGGELPRLALAAPALALCTVAQGPAFAVSRTHAACGRPLHRAALWDDDEAGIGGEGQAGSGGGGEACTAPAIPLSLAAGAAGAAPTQWGAGGGTAGASPAGGAAAGGAGGDLWSCAFCGVDCAGADVGLALTATARLVPVGGGGGSGGDGAAAALPITACGPAAAALAGGVAAEFLAWTPARRQAAGSDLVGKTVRAVLLPPAAGGGGRAEAAGVVVLP